MPNVTPLTHDGQTLPLYEWARRTGIPASTINARLHKLGWTLADALTLPVDRRFARGGRRTSGVPRPCPPLKKHGTTGLAYCRWSEHGKEHWRYFGKAGTDAAKTEYRRFAAEWAAGVVEGDPGHQLAVSVAEVVTRWLTHCAKTYLKRGKITSEVHCNRTAMFHLNDLYGDQPAAEFDGRKLRAVREAMVGRKWTRKTVNDHTSRIVRAFAWAATEKLVSVEVHRGLALVGAIAAGRRPDIPECAAVEPVPAEHVAAVLAGDHLHPTPRRRAVLAAMVRVQLLTGMRPGELCSLRADQIDRRRTPWRYAIREFNKMLHKNVERVVFFGPQAREVLAPLLDATPAGERVFRYPPWRKAAPWSAATVVGYRNRVAMACRSAGIPVWTPNRLRHNKATEVMDRYEDDAAAAAAIGNTAEVARQVYASRPGEAVARRIAEELG